jgi:hypothetical protein
MNEITFQPITGPDQETISEWVWISRQWPISLSKWIEIAPTLKAQARRFVEPDMVIKY